MLHDRSHIVDPFVVNLGQIELCLWRWNPPLQHLHHLAVFDPATVQLISIARPARIALTSRSFEGWGVFHRNRALGEAEAPRRGSSPSGRPSLTRAGALVQLGESF